MNESRAAAIHTTPIDDGSGDVLLDIDFEPVDDPGNTHRVHYGRQKVEEVETESGVHEYTFTRAIAPEDLRAIFWKEAP